MRPIKTIGVVLFVVLLMCVPVRVHAQTVTLDSILQRIDRAHPLLASFTRRAEAARATAQGARAWMSPMIGGGVFMMPYRNSMATEEKGDVMLSIQQTIVNPAKQRTQQAWQQSRASLADADRAVTRTQLRGDARRAYYSLAVLDQQRAIVRDDQERLRTLKKLAEIRYQYARGTLGNIYKAEGRLGEIDNMLQMIDAEEARYRIALNTVMSRPPDTPLMIDTANAIPSLTRILDSASPDTARLHTFRNDIRRMDLDIQTTKLGIARQRAEGRPDFELRFDYMIPRATMMPNRFTLMGMVSIPFAPWSSGMYKAEIRGMELESDAMRRARDAMLNEVTGMIATMVMELRSMDQQLTTSRQRIIPALRKNYETTLIAYQDNQVELPVVIDAWETLNMAQMDYVTRLQQYVRMVADYEQAMER